VGDARLDHDDLDRPSPPRGAALLAPLRGQVTHPSRPLATPPTRATSGRRTFSLRTEAGGQPAPRCHVPGLKAASNPPLTRGCSGGRVSRKDETRTVRPAGRTRASRPIGP